MKKIHLVDTTLRDGSHAVSHGYQASQVRAICRGLDRVGVELIEVSHGDGIAGSSINYGFSAVDEMELLGAAQEELSQAKLTVLLIPGIGTIEDLQRARHSGAQVVRVATHVTEADIGIQHIRHAKSSGMMAVGFMMMVHMVEPQVIVEQAKIFADSGADYINLADSAGYLLPDDVRSRISALRNALSIPIGFHSHNNLGLSVANSIAAVEEGAEYIDVTCRGLGAGAGNTQAEVFCAVLDRMGYETGIDLYGIQDVAEKLVEPLMLRPQVIDTSSLMLGYAGVYSSFLLHTHRAAERFSLNPRDILLELGRRRMVGGQEDMIIDVAYDMAQRKKQQH